MGVHGAQLRLVKAFSIGVFVRLGGDLMVHPFGGFEREEVASSGLMGWTRMILLVVGSFTAFYLDFSTS